MELELVRLINTNNAVQVRNFICNLEAKMRELPNVMLGDCYPLEHTFGEGIYVRQITMPAGHLIVSKIHKYAHPYFILRGECSVLTENGVVRLKAPYHGITKAGTKRALYIYEETVWVTVHATHKTNLEEIEEEIIAKSFDEVPLSYMEGELV
jgi:hypothetical protein